MSYQSGLHVDSISAVVTSPVAALGQRREEGGYKYVYAYHADTTQVVPNMGVAPATAGSSTSFMYTTNPGELCVGIVKHTTFTTATYGWLLVKGYVATFTAATPGTVAVGDCIMISTNGVFNAGVSVTSGNICGQAFAATGTGGAFSGHFVGAWAF